jgi:hypothetical protein
MALTRTIFWEFGSSRAGIGFALILSIINNLDETSAVSLLGNVGE